MRFLFLYDTAVTAQRGEGLAGMREGREHTLESNIAFRS